MVRARYMKISNIKHQSRCGKRPLGRPKLRWKDTVRRKLKAWNIMEVWATDTERRIVFCKANLITETPCIFFGKKLDKKFVTLGHIYCHNLTNCSI